MRSERDGASGDWPSFLGVFLAAFWQFSGSFLVDNNPAPCPVRSNATNDAVGLQFAQMILD